MNNNLQICTISNTNSLLQEIKTVINVFFADQSFGLAATTSFLAFMSKPRIDTIPITHPRQVLAMILVHILAWY